MPQALKTITIDHASELAQLRAENARLVALLETHGIDWQAQAPKPLAAQSAAIELEPSRLHTEEKIAIFRRLFRGRTDVYPVRWENKAGKAGYAPVCANDKFASKVNLHGATAQRARANDGPSEWKPEVCEKPRIKCTDCGHRSLIAVSDAVIYDHLAGKHTVGVYPPTG